VRLFRRSAATASMLALAFANALVGVHPASAEVDPASYSPTIGVSAGENAHSQVPVTLTLPAPGDGIRVAQVTFSWEQTPATIGTTQTARLTMQTPECVVDEDCVVERTLQTSRMVNHGQRPLYVAVSDGTQFLGSSSAQLDVDNPKPTTTFTNPSNNISTQWGAVTLAAESAPGAGGAPLAGVRFYSHSTGRETDPYVLDDTAPYSVEVPATDIAASGGSGYVYAVAEDVEGNLTPVTTTGPPSLTTRRMITVGPPAQAQFTTPVKENVASGSTTNPPLLRWTAKVPDNVGGTPYITRVQVLIDGEPWLDMPYDTVAWYNQTAKPRAIDFGLLWEPAGGPTPGSHVAQLLVTTNYGSVGLDEKRFIVNDGVVFSPVRDGGREVRDGYVVTAGSSHRFTMTARSKVEHGALTWWTMHDQSGSSYLDGHGWCSVEQAGDCPDQVTMNSSWSAPTRPGSYVLSWRAQPDNDDVATITRTLVVQARGAMSARTSTPTVRSGRRATVTGRIIRTDTAKGVPGPTVRLQWHRAGTTSWTTLGSKTADRYGRVVARPLKRATGSYRWVTSGFPGTVSPASSSGVRVKIVR